MSFSPRDNGSNWLGGTGSLPPPQAYAASTAPLPTYGNAGGSYGGSDASAFNGTSNGGTSGYAHSGTSSYGVASAGAAPYGSATGAWAQYPSYTASSMPAYSAPTYPSSSHTGFLQAPRPRDILARKRSPNWGLRFLGLLILAGGVAYVLRPFVPWIDVRANYVEQELRAVGRKYGIIAPVPMPALPPEPAPVVAVAAPVHAPPAPVAALVKPEITQLPAHAAAPAFGKGARLHGVRRGFGRGARAHAYGIGRPRHARRLAAAEAPPDFPELAAGTKRARAASQAEASDDSPPDFPQPPAAKATRAPVAEAEETAEPAEAPKPARSNAVRAAANSGDELDRLMAGAVSSGGKHNSDLDRKLATVQRGDDDEKPVKAKVAAAPARPALSMSDVKAVMADVQKQMPACARREDKSGPADVKVAVGPDGDVTSTVIKGLFAGTSTGACVESKIKAAVFPASSGLRFDYRLVVRE